MPGGTVRNVLFIVADQWRGDTLGAAGHPCVQTPHLDRLAADGTRFARHYTQASPCGPARASMLTGCYLLNHGQVGNGTPLDARLTNVAREVGRAGYEAALFGYTDTPFDPRAGTLEPDDPARWICPGFTPVEPFLFSQRFANWKAHLRARGYALPGDAVSTFLPDENRTPPPGGERGFPPARYRAEDSDTAFLADAAIRYLRAQGDRPWFVHFSCLRPHPPLIAPAPYHALYDPAAVPLPRRPLDLDATRAQHPLAAAYIDTQDLKEYFGAALAAGAVTEGLERKMRATYYGNCTEVDANVGRLLDTVEELGQYDETLVVFTSDHGDQLGDNWTYGRRGYFDAHFHVPLIVRDPRSAAGHRGRVVGAPTEHVDLAPTMLDALGLPVPEQCDGRSLLPWTRGDPEAARDWREAAHWELDFRDYPTRAVPRALGLGADADERCRLAVRREARFKYVHVVGLPPLLFDLEADPAESRNLARDAAYAGTVRGCAQAMLDWRMAAGRRGLSHLEQDYADPPRLHDRRRPGASVP